MKLRKHLILCVSFLAILGCTPDELRIEIKTSDLAKAVNGGTVEVPFVAVFDVMGREEGDDLDQVVRVARKYLDANSSFRMSQSTIGRRLTIRSVMPLAKDEVLRRYLREKHRPLALVVQTNMVMLVSTEHLRNLNEEVEEIQPLFGAKLPADSTVIRISADTHRLAKLRAVAVFIDGEPELLYETDVDRGREAEIEFKGKEGSVYSGVPIVFWFGQLKR